MTENKNSIAKQISKLIADNFDVKSGEDLDSIFRKLYAKTAESFIEAEFDNHVGYEKHSKEKKETANRRNGNANPKKIVTSLGEESITIPRDREGSFSPMLLPKREKDLTKMEELILSLYAKGQSTRDIADTIEQIYDHKISHELVSKITDSAKVMIDEWLNRPLKSCYAFVFIDCIYVPVKNGNIHNNKAFYSIIGIDLAGIKDVLGFWASDNESAHFWMNIFDEIKTRGAEEILFISMDGIPGVKEGLHAIFPNVIEQRCIVHLVRNSMKYVASKDYKLFARDIKSVYSAASLEQAHSNFEYFKGTWSKYHGAIAIWERNFAYVTQLFSFPSSIRRIMYTTNTIESFFSNLRKVTRNKTIFPTAQSVIKIFVLRTKEIISKWTMPAKNWHMVLNQLCLIDGFSERIKKYLD
jgi:putative transposase